MLGLRPTVAEPIGPVDDPLTALDAVQALETELEHVLDAGLRRARDVDPVFATDVADRVAAFVRRGGKRLRTAFAWCGWRAAGGAGDASAVLRTGAALELVQACALVHDDVMDGSPLRRGAPAMHVDLARLHREARMTGAPEAFATAAAVLAGDLALVWADDLLTETALGSPHGPRLYREWRAMRTEMVAGQYRDIHAQAAGSCGLDEAVTIATLKSALYTVERPLALGASLADAEEHTMDALRSAGRSAGLAFQLRDDLLGAFGDPALTGKPAGDDLRTHKLTYLLAMGLRLAESSGDEEAADALAIGAVSRSDDGVERMRAALERNGARAVVESRIAELAATSLRHFTTTGADLAVRREFTALVERASGVALDDAGEAA
ncbi:polyprenyl synthetase family protein [Streptomyces sp. NBC_00887]|uniref:polyprenyl synthetase family protein n=1 Tax=Streptomyces sp. NBC_00887 TaxID=2975859 RepID=UPI00386D48A5|nr:polyprenyl synthetase family protein [Streptomyces sp. NBC_00887]WSY36084.1 polyprenyl synthetase family protein [Streptomyces sp. NBC_00887]